MDFTEESLARTEEGREFGTQSPSGDKVLALVGIRMCSVSVLSDLAQQFGEFAKRRLSRTNILPGI
jgi:hypothetical protein